MLPGSGNIRSLDTKKSILKRALLALHDCSPSSLAIGELDTLLLEHRNAMLLPAVLVLVLLPRPSTRIALGEDNVGQLAQERHFDCWREVQSICLN